jgi:hypothetical protein
MQAERILELEQLLAVANESLAQSLLKNAELSRQLSDAETRNKRLKRSSRNDESALKQKLTDAQNRRF